jgi:hypothetical protein
VIPCHKHRSKHLNFNYIYLISYKIAKRQTLLNGFALFENDITDFLPAPEIKIHSRYQKLDNKKYRAIGYPD